MIRKEDIINSIIPLCENRDVDLILLKIEIEKVLETLPARSRQVVELRIYTEMTFKEIGITIGMATANAHNRFAQSMRRIRFEQKHLLYHHKIFNI
ncbi:hypothetical protein KAR91_04055 [Candidatus Pacearchaeota archaeon]|nr:hypothetical protein [Candidatus Pacearchaeota archaeon]